MTNYLEILRNEFEAGEGSFLIQIRPDLTWNKSSFSRLVLAMKHCCEEHSTQDKVDRWMASGFYELSIFVREWTTHPNFPRPYSPVYYEKAYQRLDDLAHWFFHGESPFLDGKGFDEI